MTKHVLVERECDLECGAFGTYCRCKAQQAADRDRIAQPAQTGDEPRVVAPIIAWWDGEYQLTRSIGRPDAHNWHQKIPLIRLSDYRAKVAELEALSERLKMEAQIHAQEARTANSTIAEIYQIVSGGKGEPGNWHGAEPVRKRIAELECEAKTEQQIQRAAGCLPEGYEIRICIAKDAGWVDLYDDHGSRIDDDLAGDGSLSEQVEDAIDAAMARIQAQGEEE